MNYLLITLEVQNTYQSTLQWRLADTILTKWQKLISPDVTYVTTWHSVVKRTQQHHFWGIPASKFINHNIRQTYTLQRHQGHERQGKTKEQFQIEGDWQLHVVGTQDGTPGLEKTAFGEKDILKNGYWSDSNIGYMAISWFWCEKFLF